MQVLEQVHISYIEVLSLAADYAIKKMGIKLSEHALKGVKGSVAGGVLIAGTSVYGYLQLRKEGYSVQDSLIETGKQACFSNGDSSIVYLRWANRHYY